MTRRAISLILAVFVIAAMIAPAAFAGGVLLVSSHESFEAIDAAEPKLAPWRVKNASGDKILCGEKVPFVYHGQCAFMFKGSADERAQLSQRAADIALVNQTLANGAGTFKADFTYYSDSAASILEAKVFVRYTMPGDDQGYIGKGSLLILGKSKVAGVVSWTEHSVALANEIPQGATVTMAKIIFNNLSKGGKLYIDEVYGLYESLY